MKIIKLLLLIICLSLSSLIYGVEVCKIPSGCQIDDKGICIGCIEQEFEEETEEEKLENKIEEEKEQEERQRFWKNVSLKIYGSYGISTFSFEGKNNTSIHRPYINETTYNGFSFGTRLRLIPRVSYSISTFKGSIESDLVYRDLTYGSFYYEINEQSLFLNSGFNFHFLRKSFIGVDFKILPNFTYKSNNTDKKISQYNSSYNSPVLQMRNTNLTLNYGMSF